MPSHAWRGPFAVFWRRDAQRLFGAALLLCGALLALAAPVAAQSERPFVDVVEVEGLIGPPMADYVSERLAVANADGAEAVVLRLDTAGALGVSMERIVDQVLASPVPVVVWVGPPGAQAASAGMLLGYSAHMLALAPGTIIGAATPVDLGGDTDDEATSSAAGRLVGLAELRGRDVDFARAAVAEAAVVVAAPATAGVADLPEDAALPEGTRRADVALLTEDELVERGIADLVARSLADVLRAVDGREVTVTTGSGETTTRTLSTAVDEASLRFNNLGPVRQVLHTLASPTLAYLLIVAGALCMLFELFQPGFGVAGVAGLASFGLGLYGLSVLPVNWLAFALLLLGLILLAVDLAVAGFGPLTAGGTVALTLGSFLLFNGPDLLRISAWVIAAVVVFNVAFFVVIMTTVLRAQVGVATSGAEGLVGRKAVVRSMLNPEGHVFVEGALWRARAPAAAGKVRTGTVVRVVGLDDRLTLDVEEVD